LKSPYITSSESFLSQIEPTDSADEAETIDHLSSPVRDLEKAN
jgi:hypothetical protein